MQYLKAKIYAIKAIATAPVVTLNFIFKVSIVDGHVCSL